MCIIYVLIFLFLFNKNKMKKRKVILGVISIMTLCLTACGKPNMSFDEAIDTITHSELSEMMADAEIYEQNFNISSFKPNTKNCS